MILAFYLFGALVTFSWLEKNLEKGELPWYGKLFVAAVWPLALLMAIISLLFALAYDRE